MSVINSFSGDFRFLSNFYPSPVSVEGELYPTVEHAYQAMKSIDPIVRRTIKRAKTPGEAKKMGRCVELRPGWDGIKVSVMRDLLKKKFENPFLRPQLLATEGALLEEANTWNDRFWGTCRGDGKNWLGRLLMEVRDEIRKEEAREREKEATVVVESTNE